MDSQHEVIIQSHTCNFPLMKFIGMLIHSFVNTHDHRKFPLRLMLMLMMGSLISIYVMSGYIEGQVGGNVAFGF